MTQLYKVTVPGGKPYYGLYTSASVAIVIAQCIFGVHSASALPASSSRATAPPMRKSCAASAACCLAWLLHWPW